MEKAKTIAVNMAVAALIALLLIWGNTRSRQGDQFARGEKAAAAHDVIAAIAGYEAAIHQYVPGSSLTDRAATRLWSLGEAAERNGNLDQALVAYRALRSSFYATRWLIQPGRNWIGRCDAKINELVRIQAEMSRPRQQ